MLAAAVVAGWLLWGPAPPPRSIPTVELEDAGPDEIAAIHAASDAVRRTPRSAAAWGQLAMVLHGQAYEQAARDCYAVAAELNPRDPTWPYLQGYLHQGASGGPEVAIPLFERATQLSPVNSISRLRLADMWLEQGRLEDAEQEYGKVLAADSQDALALFGMGVIAVSRGQYRESLGFLQPIADIPLVQKRACHLLASVHERLNDKAAAEQQRQRLAGLPEDAPRPDDPMIQVGRLQVGIQFRLRDAERLRQQGRVTDAIAALREAVARYPDADAAWANLGMALHHTNDPTGAEAAMRRSIELSPQTAPYRFNLGMLQLTQNRYQDAAETFRKTLELRPDFGPAHFGLGEGLQGLGELAGAAEAFRTAQRLMPERDEIRQRLEQLQDKR